VPGLVTKELYTVDEDAGVIVWILRPTEEGVRIYVWDEMAESCQAFGGARCGGIAGNGKPGEFKKNKGEEQHLFISQSFKVDESNHCEDVVNTVEWSLSKDAAPSEREFQTAVYTCSGANALGWPLLIVAFGLAVGVAWLVQKRITWLRP
jgi:hypothetical protein